MKFRVNIQSSVGMSLETAADLIYQHANNCVDCLVGMYKGQFTIDFVVDKEEDVGKSINDLIAAVGLFDYACFFIDKDKQQSSPYFTEFTKK